MFAEDDVRFLLLLCPSFGDKYNYFVNNNVYLIIFLLSV